MTAQHAGGVQITAWDAHRLLSRAGGRFLVLSLIVTAQQSTIGKAR